VRARKRFGQHFLIDPVIIDRIVAELDTSSDQMLVEIGPGRGALTLPLLRAVGSLIAVELDRDLIAPLERLCAGHGQLRIIQQDALDCRLAPLLPPGAKARLVGNLPYNISTPLLFHFLSQIAVIEEMVLMLQREVAQRIDAGPGGRQYGRLSVMVQLYCTVETLFEAPPEAFAPRPKVHSRVVRLIPRQGLVLPRDMTCLEALVKAAFGRRRKTLRNALKGQVSAARFAAAGIDPGLRAERLSVEEFIRLAECVAE